MSDIVDREIIASAPGRQARINQLRIDARLLLETAEKEQALLNKQILCNDQKRHEWVDGGGGCGGRFIDLCKHCGWEHTS